MSVQQRRDDDSLATPDVSTLAGTIRWVALAIGVACLALLALVAGVAHAAGTTDAAAPLQWHEAMGRAHGATDRRSFDATRRDAARERRDDQTTLIARPGRASAAGSRVAGATPTT